MLALLAVLLPAGVAQADPSLPGGTFIDDDGNVHEPMIEALVVARVTGGCDTEGPRYCPRVVVRRGQLATFLATALNLPPAPSAGFTDTAGSVHADSIDRVAAAGITSGFGDRTYRPNQAVTRDQMATFLARALDLDPIPVPSRGTPIATFPGLSFVPPGGNSGWSAPRFFEADEVSAYWALSFDGRSDRTSVISVVYPGLSLASSIERYEALLTDREIVFDPDDWYRSRVVPGADDAVWFTWDNPDGEQVSIVLLGFRGSSAPVLYQVPREDLRRTPSRADVERFLLGSLEIDPRPFARNF